MKKTSIKTIFLSIAGRTALRLLIVLLFVGNALLYAPALPVQAAILKNCTSSAITVTNANDSGAGSLRQAISDICPGGKITFAQGYFISLTSATLTIDHDLTIDGSGWRVSIDGAQAQREYHAYTLLTVNSGVNFTLQNLTLSNGRKAQGGGIYNDGTTSISGVTFYKNSAGDGGAIYNNRQISITSSTFSANLATGIYAAGGAIYSNSGQVTIESSTFAENSAVGYGSAIYKRGGNASISNSLITKNGGRSCDGVQLSSGITTDNFCGINFSVDNILLGTLGDYGGESNTYALMPGSLAIDAGSGCPSVDQRGNTRVGACDVGAFESQGYTVSLAGGSPQSALVSTAFSVPLTVIVAAINLVEPVNGGIISFSTPTSAATAALSAATVAISGGQATTNASANSMPGSYTVSAFTRGGSAPAYFTLSNLAPHQIFVSGNNLGIPNGDSSPSSDDGTDFGSNTVGSSLTHTFSILNNGATDLHLGATPAVTFSGSGAADFSLASAPTSTLAPGASTAFQVIFSPTAAQRLISATLNITNDDSGASPYSFALQGSACLNTSTVTNGNSSGPGSLPQAVVDICSGGVISFDGDYTITNALAGALMSIDNNLTIDGVGHTVTLNGNASAGSIFIVNPGVNFTLKNLTLTNVHAGSGSLGGAIKNAGTTQVERCTFAGNWSALGGAIYNAGDLSLTGITFSGNWAYSAGGAIYNDYDGNLYITGSTFLGNRSSQGGAIYNRSDLTVTNSTFSGNSVNMRGGAVYNSQNLTIRSSTFAGNTAGGGSSIFNDVRSGNLHIYSSLFSDGSGNNCNEELTGWSNLSDDDTCTGIRSNLLLGVLGNYGGNTQTIALLPGSPAINTSTGCQGHDGDQRGAARVVACDIGAFESQGFTLAKTGGDIQSTLVNKAFADPLAVRVIANNSVEPVDGGKITFTAPGSGASAVITGSPATISGGAASVTASANSTVGGPYNVVASAAGATGVDFVLTNMAAPDLSINDVSQSEGHSGTTIFTFTISLSYPAPLGGVSFDITTADDTATEPADYAAQSLTSQTIPAGNSTYTFTVTVNGDTTVETDETFFVNLTNVTNATVTDGQGQGTISNDDFVPTVTTGAASAITQTSATLNGTVNANGSSTAVTIEYWLGSNPATTVSATPSPVTGSTDTAVSYSLTGLTPNTIYTYHVIGTSAVGTAQGADVSFTTSAQAPSVTTDAASAITIDGATLNGTVNAQNDSTTVSFEYGPTTAYGTTVNTAESPVTGLTDHTVSYALSGLTLNTLYHYRAVGINSGGTTNGSDRTFTTLPLSVVINTEIHNAAHSMVTFASLLESLHASATVIGNGATAATGTVTFTVFENPACSGTGTAAGTITLASGLAEPSQSAMLTMNGLSFRAHYDGDTNYPAANGTCISITTSPYLTILTLSANALPQDGSVLTASPANLIVQFSRDVLHNRISDTNSAENPVNYLLVAPGANGAFDTQSCGPAGVGGLKTDDTQITVDSISYDPGTFTAKLRVNNGSALSNGVYRLFICGTTSITDVTGKKYLNNHLSDSLVNFTLAVPSNQPDNDSDSDNDPATLPATGFAPGRLTLISSPKVSYSDLVDLWLEIPALGIKTVIVGVPQSTDGSTWDVSWLGSQAGWLNGSAFPTHNGNSVLTGHVWNADNMPGLFVNLKLLSYGDPLIIHAFGQVYTYEVRDIRLVSPSAVDTALKHEDLSWVTLVTCEDFSPHSNQYDFRRIVRAVLIHETGDK